MSLGMNDLWVKWLELWSSELLASWREQLLWIANLQSSAEFLSITSLTLFNDECLWFTKIGLSSQKMLLGVISPPVLFQSHYPPSEGTMNGSTNYYMRKWGWCWNVWFGNSTSGTLYSYWFLLLKYPLHLLHSSRPPSGTRPFTILCWPGNCLQI